ncbi:AAA family ATPase [Endozoicomonas acroporae]|uniref:AAA family ATPase n=1 Tax=Endozoicomonas acroporae TaxID=1701104 RepID=UPI0013D35C0F|nr:AAA family ATPase [Endozoicomonas acroporae]
MTIVEQITEWVNQPDKAGWWRFTVRKALELGELSQPDYEEIYQIAKMEFGLTAKVHDFDSLVSLVAPAGFGVEEEAYNLTSISQVSHVSSLSSDQRIQFSPTGITVVYGDNGVGKSSYAKILKNACLTRGDAPEVIPNIFTGANGTPSAVIEVESNGTSQLLTWQKGGDNHAPLKSIRVFDSYSSAHYLSKSDSIDYRPAALALLDEVVNAASYISAKCTSDVAGLRQSLVLPQMHSDTAASELATTINSITTIAQVEAHCATDDEAEALPTLQLEHRELTTNTPKVLRQRYQSKRKSLEPFRDFLLELNNRLGDRALKDCEMLYQKSVTTREASNRLGEEAFSRLPIDKIGSHEWQVMWKAVETFVSEANPGKGFPPAEGEICPTCLQTIGEESSARLDSFHQYLKNEIHKEASAANKAFKDALTVINSANTDTQPYIPVLELVGGFNADLREKLGSLISAFIARKDAALGKTPDFSRSSLDLGPLEWLDAQIKSLSEKEAGVKDDEAQAKTIADKLKVIQETEDRLKIREYKQAILDEIEKAKLRDKYSKLSGTTTSSAVTRKNTEISASSSIAQIHDYFIEELRILGFKHYAVEAATRGSRGKQMLSLKLSGNGSKLPDIASEGEQKCISLAGFLAELRVDDRKSAVIFDDPVNSLAQKWRLKFAERISEEAKHRQVIVLTHDLPFLMMLQETAEEINVLALTRNSTTTGLLLDRLPWDSMKTAARINDLKGRLPELRKLFDENEEAFQVQARSTYIDMRKAWERLIEEWLIKGIVERFGRGVKPTNVRYLVDTQESDVATINDAMNKCSRCCHDTASELGATYPDVDELEQDINDFEAYFKELRTRRNARNSS